MVNSMQRQDYSSSRIPERVARYGLALLFVAGCSVISTESMARYYFSDEFGSDRLDPNTWILDQAVGGKRWCDERGFPYDGPGDWEAISINGCNGVVELEPFGAIDVRNGVASFSSNFPRVFPYVWRGPPVRRSPIPISGDFSIEFRVQYFAFGGSGSGVKVRRWQSSEPEGNNPPNSEEETVLRIWADRSVYARVLGARVDVGDPTEFHTYLLTYVGGAYSLYVDGTLRLGPVASDIRPNTILLGNAVHPHNFSSEWTGFNVDYVRVEAGRYASSKRYAEDTIVFSGITDLTTPDGRDEELFGWVPNQDGPFRITRNDAADGTPSIHYDGNDLTLIFASDRDGDWDLYKTVTGGSSSTEEPIKLTHNETNDGWPLVSPDGAQLLYKNDGILHSMGLDGEGMAPLRAADNKSISYGHAAWSPNAEEIVLSHHNVSGATPELDDVLALITLGETNTVIPLLIPNEAGIDIDYPVFTNDAQFVLFSSNDCPGQALDNPVMGVHILNLATGERERVVCDPESDYRHLFMSKSGRLLFSRASNRDSTNRGVFLTQLPLNWRSSDVSEMALQIRSAVELSDIGTSNNHPVSVQAYSAVSSRPKQEVLVMPGPSLSKNAVVLTHGFNSSIENWIVDQTDGVDGMADRICSELGLSIDDTLSESDYIDRLSTYCSGDDWDVLVEDWRSDAKFSLVAWEFGPLGAFGKAYEQGFQLALELLEREYENVHLLAHSAGSNLINEANTALKRIGGVNEPTTHLTFFDAYDPLASLSYCGQSLEQPQQYSKFGLGADWVDNYVDNRRLLSILGEFDATRLMLPAAFNVDVTAWDPNFGGFNPLARHNWPYNFYRQYTMTTPDGVEPLGFGISREALGADPMSDRQPQMVCRLADFPGDNSYPRCQSVSPVCDQATVSETAIGLDDPLVVIHQTGESVTGTIGIGTVAGAAKLFIEELFTGSPAWVEFVIDSPTLYNAIRFRYSFLQDAQGHFSVYFDGIPVYEADQRLHGMQAEPSPLIPVGAGQGSHTIAFRLDNFGTGQAGVSISDFELIDRITSMRMDPDSDGAINENDRDDDGDGILDALDAFPLDAREWLDNDGDGIGDNIDIDDDNDGLADRIDSFPTDRDSGDVELDDVLLVSSVLPTSRSVRLGNDATAFATIINTGSDTAVGCRLALVDSELEAYFFFQPTNLTTNHPVGQISQPVDISSGKAQSFVFGITPIKPLESSEIELLFRCDNSAPASSVVGLNTLLLSATDGPVADVVALTATQRNDGIVHIDSSSKLGAFAVASVNVGDSSDMLVKADTGSSPIPVDLSLCQTDAATGACINPPQPSSNPIALSIEGGDTPTFSVFVSSDVNVPFDPSATRIFVRFVDAAGQTRGATSVAVRSE